MTSRTTFNDDLITHLGDQAGLTELVSTRIYTGILPQNPTVPVIVINMVSSGEIQTHEGPAGLETPRIQADIYDDDGNGARAVRDQLKAALNGLQQETIGSATKIGHCFFDGESDGYDDTVRLFRITLDFLIMWNEIG